MGCHQNVQWSGRHAELLCGHCSLCPNFHSPPGCVELAFRGPAAGNSRKGPRPPYPLGAGSVWARGAAAAIAQLSIMDRVEGEVTRNASDGHSRTALRDDWKLRLEKSIQPSGYLLSALP